MPGGFLAPSLVQMGDQPLVQAEKQGAEGPGVVGPTEGEDALWRELSEELRRARELPEVPVDAHVASYSTQKVPAPEPVKKARRTRQSVKSQLPASSAKDAHPPADVKPALPRLLAPVSTLSAAVRHISIANLWT